MHSLEQYEQEWAARGRTIDPQQHRGLQVAHRKAGIAPYVLGLGGLIAVSALVALGSETFHPLPTIMGLLAAAGLILAGSLARSAHLAALHGTLRARQLGNSGTAAWLATVLAAVASVACLAAAVAGLEPVLIVLAVLVLLGAAAPWFIK